MASARAHGSMRHTRHNGTRRSTRYSRTLSTTRERSTGAFACDVCGGRSIALFRSAARIAADRHAAHRGLDRVVLDRGADLYQCATCGSLWRDPASLGDLEQAYRKVHYPIAVADELRRRARLDLERDLTRLTRYGLARGAHLLEIGSYVGAFLDLAREAGCRVTGIDINADLDRSCRARGHDVRAHPFAADDFANRQFDGVWILNCFEALADLHATLEGVRQVLRPSGTLVIRTPNAEFVALAHTEPSACELRTIADQNGLLGMPFRRSLSPRALKDLVATHGFDTVDFCGRAFSSACADHITSGQLGSSVATWLELCAAVQPPASIRATSSRTSGSTSGSRSSASAGFR